jgi:two-component system chemotaxis response regulator CheY
MKTCLVVDDSRVVRKVARRIIEGLGFTCAEAEDGQAAYDACSAGMPDAVLLDWNMPVMSGIEFLEKLRELDGGKNVKVLFCTAEGDAAHIKRALDAGADEYIMKPFDTDIMLSKFTLVGLLQPRYA